MEKPILHTENLTIGYGRRAVQSGLCLTAYPRDLICLTGTNGAGKSTLLRTLAGLQKPLAGTIAINGASLHDISRKERAKLFSLVLTERIDIDNLTVHDLVAYGRFPYTGWAGGLSEEDERMIDTALAHVNLTHKKECMTNEISDGEKQRAVIAKALAQDTPIVLLDEPTAHLDLPNRIEIMMLLRRLSVNTGKTFILSTHELDLALQTADKIWLFSEERLECGIPEDLMLSGKFQRAFGSDKFLFDEEDGHCKVNHIMGDLKVNVTGEHLPTVWLSRALHRCGIGTDARAERTIKAIASDRFEYGGECFSSIETVINRILQLDGR